MAAASRSLHAQPWTTNAPPAIPNGIVFPMPMGGGSGLQWSRKNGMSLEVDMRWANNYGYRPVEIKITSQKPTAVDHEIKVRLHAGWWAQGGSVAVEQDFEMPKGATTATTTISCPQYQLAVQFFWWEVWIDGLKDKDLSIDEITAMTSMSGQVSAGGTPGFVFLTLGPAKQNRLLAMGNSQDHQLLSLAAANLPTNWIDYTCFDVIALSLTELLGLSSTNPEALEAIRQWVNAGGQLWIDKVGEDWEKLADVNKTLRLPTVATVKMEDSPSDPNETDKQAEVKVANEVEGAQVPEEAKESQVGPSFQPGWRPYRFRRGPREDRVVTFFDRTSGTTSEVRDPYEITRLENDPRYMATSEQKLPSAPEGRGRNRRGPRDSSRWFVEHPLGLGYVRAFADHWDALTNMNAGPSFNANNGNGEPVAQWQPGLSLALRSTRQWTYRHGLSPDAANPDFAKLLVPGVGLAPVTEFEILITLFVLLIGPLNYWLLKRSGRLHLLVLTVPVAAVLMTGMLFGYALLSDGFGTTVRARSFTSLDQRTGEAACWSRLSYYSGLAPGSGLTLPNDVAIYPIIPGWNESSVDANVGGARELVWTADQQKLTRGWLRSRTPTQYLTVRARKSPAQLQLIPKNERLEAKNELGTAIKYVVVIDETGTVFTGEDLAVGAKVFLTPTKQADAVRAFQKFVVDNQPQTPPELSGDDSDFAIFQRRQQRRVLRGYGLQYSEQRLAGNLLDRAIADLAGLEGQAALPLPPKSYVAVTQTGPEVVLGIPHAEEEASFHVVFGQW